jgi:hypothetical protein
LFPEIFTLSIWSNQCDLQTCLSMCFIETEWQASSFYKLVYVYCWSQWQRDLWREMSSPAQMLESWVWIPLKAWTFPFILIYLVEIMKKVSMNTTA